MAQRMCKGCKKNRPKASTVGKHARGSSPLRESNHGPLAQAAADESEAKPTAIGQSNIGAAHTDLPPPCEQ